MQEQLIELYCQTGRKRAEALIMKVIENTGLPFRKEILSIFGCWTWDYADMAPSLWKQALPVLKSRITQLFLDGTIISGRWGY